MPRRPDATLVETLPAYRRLMPVLLPRRMDAVVFLRLPVEVDGTLERLAAHRAATGARITLFQVVLAAIVETLAERPHMNRFVKGGRLWQRDHVALTFAVKRRFDDRSRIVSTKVRFAPGDGLHAVVERTADAIGTSRHDADPRADRRTRAAGGWPAPVRSAALAASEHLDRRGWLPRSMVDDSPLHTSAMVSNLGSFGLDGALHHLYEAGTCSINATLGRVKRVPVCDEDGTIRTPRRVEIAFAYDERICDGHYAAVTLAALTRRIAEADPGRRP